MASNNISKYYKVDSGLDLTSDSQFATLSANEKIVYKPSGEKYIKNSNYSNVFDKTDTFGELESKINTNNTSITKLEEKVDTKVIAKIDDADGNGVCSCKNNNNTQIDTFACHISKTSNNPTLSWGQTSTIGTVDGTPLTVKMPANPDTNTIYSAGNGIDIINNNINIENSGAFTSSNNGVIFENAGYEIEDGELVLKIPHVIIDHCGRVVAQSCGQIRITLTDLSGTGTGDTGTWATLYFLGVKEVGDIVSGSNLFYDIDRTSSAGSGSWRLMWINVNEEWYSGADDKVYFGKFQKVG